MKKIIMVTIVLSFLLSLSACTQPGGDYSRLMVQVIALDRSADGKCEVSMLAYKADRSAGAQAGAGEMPGGLVLVSGIGDSVQAAISNVSITTGLMPFYAHNNGIILGEEAAKKDIGKILNSFLQYSKMRPSVNVFVCRGEAKKLVELSDDGKDSMALQIDLIVRSGEESGAIAGASMKEILSREISPYEDAYVPVIQKEKSNTGEELASHGTAVFRGGQLMGYLNETETRGLMLVLGQMKGGVAVIPQADIGSATYEFTDCTSSVSADIEQGKPVYDITVRTRVNVYENNRELDLRYGSPDLASAKHAVESYIKDCVGKAVSKACGTFNADIFLFAQRLHLKEPVQFAGWGEEWRTKVSEGSVRVHVEADIRQKDTPVIIHE